MRVPSLAGVPTHVKLVSFVAGLTGPQMQDNLGHKNAVHRRESLMLTFFPLPVGWVFSSCSSPCCDTGHVRMTSNVLKTCNMQELVGQVISLNSLQKCGIKTGLEDASI